MALLVRWSGCETTVQHIANVSFRLVQVECIEAKPPRHFHLALFILGSWTAHPHFHSSCERLLRIYVSLGGSMRGSRQETVEELKKQVFNLVFALLQLTISTIISVLREG